jgi:DNA-binding transcriptional LysR family regulator
VIDPSLLPALHGVLTVTRAGSVSEAARRLHRTPSAVSQQIRRVKAHFGVDLFRRAGRGLRLTPEGEAALPAVARLFDDAEALFGLIAAGPTAAAATLRVAASDYLGKALLVPVLRALAERRAPLTFDIITTHSAEAERLVARAEVDVAIVTSLARPAAHDVRRLFHQPFVWVGPRTPGRGRRRPLHERLADEPVLRLAPGSHGRRMLDAYLERARIRPRSTIDVPSVSLLLAYVAGGIGIGLAPALAVDGSTGRDVAVERARIAPLPVVLNVRAGLYRGPAASDFLARVTAEGRRARARLARSPGLPAR